MPHRAWLCVLVLAALGASVLAADTPGIKPPIRGLVSMGAYRFVGAGGEPINTLEPLNAKPGIFGGLVVVASWAQLQPTADATIGDGNVIDKAMAEVRAYNAKHPDTPLAVRLRVWGGFMAPDWVRSLGGAPIVTTHNEKKRILGRFWSKEYRQAWGRLQAQLAAKYDSWPLIREVSVTSCMSFTAEPFFLPGESPVQKPLRAAGFSEKAYRECLSHALEDYAPWKSTRLVLSVNPFRAGKDEGPGDPEFTMALMKTCRQALGRRCVFDNHNLDADLAKPLVPIYALMKRMGPELAYQTFNKTPKDFDGTIRKGVAQGAGSIELWQDYGGFPDVPDAQLKKWAKWLDGDRK